MAVPRGSGAMPPFFAFRAPGRRGRGAVPTSSVGARAERRPLPIICVGPGVHTAIICVGRDDRAYTHNYQLFMYVGAFRGPI